MAVRGASGLAWCLRRVGASAEWLLLEAGTQVSRARSSSRWAPDLRGCVGD